MNTPPFPCRRERLAASALLQLSAEPPSLSSTPPKLFLDEEECLIEEEGCKNRESLVMTESRSSSSSLSVEVSSAKRMRAKNRMRIISVVAHFREMKLKVVQKSRSKIYWSSDGQKFPTGNMATITSGSVSTEVSSLSNNSTAASSAGSLYASRWEKRSEAIREDKRRKHMASAHMRRRADSILKFLSSGCSSEVNIRQVLGDSPDTSKALRMLLKMEEVKRSGTGGRHDPYIYKISSQVSSNSSSLSHM